MDDVTIRKYCDEDRGQLAVLWRTVFPNDPPHNEPEYVIDAKRAVDDLIFVAESSGTLYGACMAGYDGHRGWLYALAVLPEYRRKRIGSGLVEYAVRSLKLLGCRKVNLQIRSTNAEVETFYSSLGFRREDRLSMGTLID
jgi:ribosomal protein S18 acetylase RimI-like enzyme